tara:strand:- start:5439 stop:6392 length:954 start_codon:yes stop_codon:yes gene_type:complete
MRDTSAVFRAIARSNKIKVGVLIEATFSSGAVNLWNGYGNLTYSGVTYAGAGKLLDISAVQESIETRANGFSATLSGLDSSLLAIALDEAYTGRPFKAKICFLAPDPDQETSINIKVQSTSGGNKYFIEEGQQAQIDLKYGNKYIFDVSDSSVDGHPFLLSTTSDGTHASGSIYGTGVTYFLDGVATSETDYKNPTNFNAASTRQVKFTVPASGSYPTNLYYFCAIHSGMGGSLSPSSDIIIYQPYTIFDGFMDVMRLSDSGGTANISVNCESQLIALERPNTRRYTPEDQKIDFPNDEGLDFVAGLQDDEIVWGRG